jgi:hypothetical protein
VKDGDTGVIQQRIGADRGGGALSVR